MSGDANPREPSKEFISKLVTRLPDKPKSKIWYKFINGTFFLGMVFVLGVLLVSLHWFIERAKVFYVFWPYISTSVSGWIWVAIPEYILLGLIGALLFYFIYRQTDWPGVAWADVISAIIVFVLIAFNFTTVVGAVDNISYLNQLNQSIASTSYRIWFRDQHVKDLVFKQEYYGVVVNSTEDLLTVDHGGVLLDFKITNSDIKKSPELLGKRIWVRFIFQDNQKEMVEFKLFD